MNKLIITIFIAIFAHSCTYQKETEDSIVHTNTEIEDNVLSRTTTATVMHAFFIEYNFVQPVNFTTNECENIFRTNLGSLQYNYGPYTKYELIIIHEDRRICIIFTLSEDRNKSFDINDFNRNIENCMFNCYKEFSKKGEFVDLYWKRYHQEIKEGEQFVDPFPPQPPAQTKEFSDFNKLIYNYDQVKNIPDSLFVKELGGDIFGSYFLGINDIPSHMNTIKICYAFNRIPGQEISSPGELKTDYQGKKEYYYLDDYNLYYYIKNTYKHTLEISKTDFIKKRPTGIVTFRIISLNENEPDYFHISICSNGYCLDNFNYKDIFNQIRYIDIYEK